jgi:hypothetical protein
VVRTVSEPFINRTPPGDPRSTTTPASMARTLCRFVPGRVLSVPSRATFTEWLVDCKTGGNRLRAGLPTSWVIGDTTGNNGSDAEGDIAGPRPTSPSSSAYTPGAGCLQPGNSTLLLRPLAASLESSFSGSEILGHSLQSGEQARAHRHRRVETFFGGRKERG